MPARRRSGPKLLGGLLGSITMVARSRDGIACCGEPSSARGEEFGRRCATSAGDAEGARIRLLARACARPRAVITATIVNKITAVPNGTGRKAWLEVVVS